MTFDAIQRYHDVNALMRGPMDNISFFSKRVLTALQGYGDRLTREVAIEACGCADLRRDSQLIRCELLLLERAGWVKKMDAEKPVAWKLTPDGERALKVCNGTIRA